MLEWYMIDVFLYRFPGYSLPEALGFEVYLKRGLTAIGKGQWFFWSSTFLAVLKKFSFFQQTEPMIDVCGKIFIDSLRWMEVFFLCIQGFKRAHRLSY